MYNVLFDLGGVHLDHDENAFLCAQHLRAADTSPLRHKVISFPRVSIDFVDSGVVTQEEN